MSVDIHTKIDQKDYHDNHDEICHALNNIDIAADDANGYPLNIDQSLLALDCFDNTLTLFSISHFICFLNLL